MQTFKGMNPRRIRFIDEFMIDGNATQAAIRAGYGANTAAITGYRLLQVPSIIREIERRVARDSVRKAMNREELAERLEWIVKASMSQYMRANDIGEPQLTFSSLTQEEAYALSEVTVESYTEGRGEDAQEVKRVRFKKADVLKAAKLLAAIRGWEKPKKMEVSVRSAIAEVSDKEKAAAAYAALLDGEENEGTD